MKEDIFEREIKRFVQMLLSITGLVGKDKFEEALFIIREHHDEALVNNFLENRLTVNADSPEYKKLLFNADLLYHKIWIYKKRQQPYEEWKGPYLALAKKLLSTGNVFDYSLQMKIEEIEYL